MLSFNNHEITRVEIKEKKSGITRVISYIRLGADLVWQAVRSCFGVGSWSNDKPWDNTEGWKNE